MLRNRTVFNILRHIETKAHVLNYLFWECTLCCNLNCLHCGSDCTKDNTKPDMPLTDFLSAIDTIPKTKEPITIVFTGGEPLLRKDIARCGYEIRKRNLRWSMVSNGLLYTNEKHIELLNAGLGALTISLDGMTKNHNWLRNSNCFDRVAHAIEIAANSPRLNFDIVTCVNSKNIIELREIYNFLLSIKVKQWRLFTIAPIGRAIQNNSLFLNNIEFRNMLNFIKEVRNEKKMKVQFSCEGYVGKLETQVKDTYFFCRAGINIGSILIDGSISACPNIDRQFSQGNIYKDNFYKIWQNKYQIFRNRNWLKSGICFNCSDFKNCLGNGFHLRQKDNKEVLVCHKKMIKE